MNRLTALLALALIPSAALAQDTLVVRADNPPVWGTNPRLVEELRIGVIEGDERYQFGVIADVVELESGEVWVADRTLGAIRRYSSTGAFLGNVGRKGQGPGEFSYIASLRSLPDGRVAVWDPSNTRIHLFDETGSLAGAFRSPTAAYVSPQSLEADTAGQLYIRDADPGVFGSAPFRVPRWVRLSSAGEILDTILAASISRAEYFSATSPLISPLGYLLLSRHDEYAFWWPLRDGRIVRVERSWTPVRYESAERREYQARLDATRGDVTVPEYKDPVSNWFVDADGRLWMTRNAPATKGDAVEGQPSQEAQRFAAGMGINIAGLPPITWSQPAIYEVIEPTGRLLGSVTVPGAVLKTFGGSTVELAFAKGMTLLTIQKGEFGEQYVVKYRIEPGN